MNYERFPRVASEILSVKQPAPAGRREGKGEKLVSQLPGHISVAGSRSPVSQLEVETSPVANPTSLSTDQPSSERLSTLGTFYLLLARPSILCSCNLDRGDQNQISRRENRHFARSYLRSLSKFLEITSDYEHFYTSVRL